MKKSQGAKLPKGVSQEFLDSLNSMGTGQLQDLVFRLQVQNDENEQFKETEGYLAAEDEFATARERHNLVVSPVKDLTIGIKNRTKEVIKRLKEKGAI